MFDIVGVGVLVVVALLFGWLASRAWKIKSGVLRWPATILSGLVAVLAALLTVGAVVGYSRLNASQPNPVRDVKVALTPENIARGEKFARACAGCHSSNNQLPLTGNNFLPDAPVGTMYAPNLTQTHLKGWSDGEIIRAIREGVARNGRSLLIMPSASFRNFSDEDVQSIVAYLRSQGEIGPDSPPNSLNVVGALFLGLNPPLAVQPPITAAITAPPAGATAEYGSYLVSSLSCQECHGANLAGRVATPGDNGPPTSPNLRGITDEYSEAQFFTALRMGVKEDGQSMAKDMPFKDFEKLSDDDLRAIYAYLKTLKP